jgi:hypothetical protein
VETMNKIWPNFSLWSETAIGKSGKRKKDRHKETGKGKDVDKQNIVFSGLSLYYKY